MADPLSVTASILAVVTGSMVSIRSLENTVERYRGRDETLQRLLGQLDDIISVLEALEQFARVEASMLSLMKGPVERCRQLCHEFEKAMKDFAGKSKTDFRDWAKLEFMKGDINEFMGTLSGYKSTISVGLGTITLQTSKATQDILQQYSEVVLDTNYNLNIQLQRINEKMDRFPSEEPVSSGMDLKDERAVIEHCIRICEEAMSHIGTLDDRERQLCSDALSEQATSDAASSQPKLLQVHQETRQILQGSRDNIAKFLGRLQERLWSMGLDGHPEMERERMQLKEDINALEDSLKVCKIASGEVSRQKVHRFREIVTEGESDQVVVTTWADLFNVEKATSKGNSAQLIGSMTGEELIQLSRDRYDRLERWLKIDAGSVNGLVRLRDDETDAEPRTCVPQGEESFNPNSPPCGSTTFESPSVLAEEERAGQIAPKLVVWMEIITLRINKLQNKLLDHVQKRVPPGYVRVSWTCRCGKRLRVTVVKIQQATALAFAQHASRTSDANSISVEFPDTGDSSSIPSNTVAMGDVDTSQGSEEPILAPSIGAGQICPDPFISAGTKKYLLLCVNTGMRLIRVANVDVTDLNGEEEMFQRLQQAYRELRGKWGGTPFIKPRRMHYVKFQLLCLRKSRECVGNYKTNSIPSRAEIIRQEYAFSPCPPHYGEVPIPPDVFMHIFLNPGDHLGPMTADMLPKKLHSKLSWDSSVHNAVNLPTGWGFYIVEDIDWLSSAWCIVSIVLAITVFTVAWSITTQDLQGGTGLGQYCAAMLAILVSIFVLGNGAPVGPT